MFIIPLLSWRIPLSESPPQNISLISRKGKALSPLWSLILVVLLFVLALISLLFVFYYSVSFLLFHCVSDLLCHGILSSFADLQDLFHKGLVSKLETIVIASRAPGTIDAYRRAFNRRKSFAVSSAELLAFPTKTKFVALYTVVGHYHFFEFRSLGCSCHTLGPLPNTFAFSKR